MKKFLLVAFTVFMATFLFACDQSNYDVIESDEQLVTLQALSSTSLLSYNQSYVEDTSYQPLNNRPLDNEVLPRANQELENIDYYVEMMELFLSDNNLEVIIEESDLEDYSFKTVYKTINLNGDQLEYVFYYNEFEFDDEAEPLNNDFPENENEQRREFNFEDEDDHLAVTGLQGVLIFGETTYNIEGKKIQNEQFEIYRLRSFVDEDNYVMVNYQVDTEDNNREKFFFKLVAEGEVVSQSKVHIFTRANMTHVRLEYVEETKSGRFLFNIKEIDDVSYIMINYEIKENGEIIEKGNIRLSAQLDETTGEMVYSFNIKPDRSKQEYQEEKRHKIPEQAPMINRR
jgi:hypothetical protein